MPQDYYSLVTNQGLIKEAASNEPGGTAIDLTEMAVGDSNGTYYDPDGSETALANEVHRVNLTHIVVDENNTNQLIVEAVLDETIGPFYIREVGIFDSNGDLFAIGKYPETFKPNLPAGSGKRLYIRMILGFANSPNVNLVINNDIALDPNFGTDVNNALAERLVKTNNLSDLNNIEDARDNLQAYSKEYLNHKIGKNYLINGNFDIWQRGTSFIAIPDDSYSTDRWKNENNLNTGLYSASRSNDVPTFVQSGRVFNYSHSIECTTAEELIDAGEYCLFSQNIEGYNFAPIAQKQLTLSFWVKATKPGIYSVAFRNSVFDKSYVAEYIINASDVWEFKNITTEASPSNGTWNYTNGLGLSVSFILVGGSTYQTATVNSWIDGNYFSTLNQVNFLDNVNNSFKLCGIQLEEGEIATSFKQRNIAEELELCQRYFEFLDIESASFYANSASSLWNAGQFNYKTEKRASPTLIAQNITYNNCSDLLLSSNKHSHTGRVTTVGAVVYRVAYEVMVDAEI